MVVGTDNTRPTPSHFNVSTFQRSNTCDSLLWSSLVHLAHLVLRVEDLARLAPTPHLQDLHLTFFNQPATLSILHIVAPAPATAPPTWGPHPPGPRRVLRVLRLARAHPACTRTQCWRPNTNTNIKRRRQRLQHPAHDLTAEALCGIRA
ncbi:hypothetical protein BC826DRAFT_1113568 [Russula brevipes]|nr:hypothetical protein BC826DRAFT_1113568 [Russula brevipes]